MKVDFFSGGGLQCASVLNRCQLWGEGSGRRVKGMAKTQRKQQGAVLIHGADGRLYFISKDVLKEHKLSPQDHKKVVKKAPGKTLSSVLRDIGRMKSDAALVSSVSVRDPRKRPS
jgi:hypothetical protein